MAPPALATKRPTGIGDVDLVLAARGGDRFAQGALYQRHSPQATRLAARLLGTHTDAEDVLHDAFFEALSKLDQLREPGAFRSWLLRIVVMNVRQRLRRRALQRRLGLYRSEDDATLEALASPDANPEELACLSLIDDVLMRCSTDERVAWMLARVEGHTLSEISELMGIPTHTVKRRIARVDGVVARVVEVKES